MNKRRLNLRPTIMILLGMVMALITVALFFVFDTTWSNIMLAILIVLLIVFSTTVAILSFVLHHSFVKTYGKHCLLLTIAFFLTFGYGYIIFHNLENLPNFHTEVVIIGEVDNDTNGLSYQTLTLTDVKVVDNTGDIVKLKYDVSVPTYNVTDKVFELGESVAFRGYLEKLPLKDYLYRYVSGTAYTAEVEYTATYGADLDFTQGFCLSVKDMLLDTMNEDLALLCYGVLFGDQDHMDEGVSKAFSISGLSHMIAVSGLNIGLFVSILTFLLKKTKISRWVRLIIIALVLAFYCHLCDYSPSCVRAAIMSLVMLLGYILGVKHDILSSLGVAGILILLVQPLQLFSINLQLSFISMLSIMALYPTIEKLLSYTKLPKFIIETFGLTLAANIGLLPAMIHYFSSFSLVGLISNMIAIPLFNIAYASLVFALLIAFVLPFCHFILNIPKVLFHGIVLIAKWFSGFSFATITVHDVGLITILLLIFLMILLQYFMCAKRTKWIASTIAMIFMIVSLVGYNIPSKVTQSALHFVPNTTSIIVEDETNGKRYLLGYNQYETIDLEEYLTRNKMFDFDGLFLWESDYFSGEHIADFVKSFDVDTLYVASQEQQILLQDAIVVDNMVVGSCKINPFIYNEKVMGYSITIGAKDLLFLHENTKLLWEDFETIKKYDIIYVERLTVELETLPPDTPQIVVLETTKTRVAGIQYLDASGLVIEV